MVKVNIKEKEDINRALKDLRRNLKRLKSSEHIEVMLITLRNPLLLEKRSLKQNTSKN